MTNILIFGSSNGKTGRRIAQRLTNNRDHLTASRASGDIRIDLGDPATWAPALDGVTAAYIMEPACSPTPRDGSASPGSWPKRSPRACDGWCC